MTQPDIVYVEYLRSRGVAWTQMPLRLRSALKAESIRRAVTRDRKAIAHLLCR